MDVRKSPFAEAAVQAGTGTVGFPSLEGVQGFAIQSPLCWWLPCSAREAGPETPCPPSGTSLSPCRQGESPLERTCWHDHVRMGLRGPPRPQD